MISIYYTWLEEALQKEFVLVRLLKQSERGTIELIRHRSGNQKFILRRFHGNAEVYRRLLGYTCPNLPEIYEVASDGDCNLLIEEYISGDNMGVMLKDSLFSPEETRDIIRKLCRGLWVLHSIGAVHRDVKPENIILRGADAVLIDFDAARLHKINESRDTQVLGTTGFAAPEQYGLSQSDARTDIYSLGVLINVMLTGHHPSLQLAEGHFGRVVTRCTQVNPQRRYHTVLQLLDEL